MAAMLKHPMQVRISPIFLRDYFFQIRPQSFLFLFFYIYFYTVDTQSLEAYEVPYGTV